MTGWTTLAPIGPGAGAGTTQAGKMRIFPSVAVALLLPLITDVQAQGLACGGTQKQQQVAELMFGRKIVDRIAVTEDEWAGLGDREITPRFPDGLTVFSAAGQWRDPDTS